MSDSTKSIGNKHKLTHEYIKVNARTKKITKTPKKFHEVCGAKNNSKNLEDDTWIFFS